MGSTKRPFLRAIASLFLILFLTSCGGQTISNDSPAEEQYAEGERLLKKERYLEAVERFRIIRSRYPHSKYAALSSLRIGDAHFEEEAYIEAASAYRSFRELYPKHEQVDHALFRIGEANYRSLPSTNDRDIEPAEAAIDALEEYQKLYPGHANVEEARKKVAELKTKLAEKEDYIGNFYFIRDHFTAAASRYKSLLDKFSGFGFDEKALFRLAFSYQKIGELTKASEALERLSSLYPNSDFHKDADKLMGKIKQEQGGE